MTIALVTGSLAPNANCLYEAYAKIHAADLHVFQCAKAEPGRKWKFPEPQNYTATTLAGFRAHLSDIRHIYVNPGIIPALARLRPDTVIIGSFSPTMILAGLYAHAAGMSLGLGIEGRRDIDPGDSSWAHAWARRLLAPRATFGICSCSGGREMMEHWGLAPGKSVMVPRFVAWDAPRRLRGFDERPFDLLLCGSLNDRKNPLFFADVVDRLVTSGSKPRVRIVGDGPLHGPFAARLAAAGVEAQFDGYLQQEGIIEAYQSAKLLLFPTLGDIWGFVANEALQCGTPVLASPHAVSSSEVVEAFGTGLVRRLDVDDWASAVRTMLGSRLVWQSFMARRDEAMAKFNIDNAVAGLAKAIEIGRASRRERQGRFGQGKPGTGSAQRL